jgi:hypothetical protein
VNWLVGDQSYLGTCDPKNDCLFTGSVTQWNSPRSIQISLRLSF